ncbi:MAG: GtrA family protein, partial [Candidatus Methanoplasma sp.]|nr:GtrA family protein [Candidatus Methanoplasma sp.]
MDSFRHIFREHREGILYLFFGVLTVLVSWGTYALFVFAGIELNISNVLSWICAVTFAYAVNKWFVFRSRSLERTVLAKEVSSFFLLRILTGVAAMLVFPVLLEIGLDQPLLGTPGLIARIIVSGI